jgi:hypothetical protein
MYTCRAAPREGKGVLLQTPDEMVNRWVGDARDAHLTGTQATTKTQSLRFARCSATEPIGVGNGPMLTIGISDKQAGEGSADRTDQQDDRADDDRILHHPAQTKFRTADMIIPSYSPDARMPH